MSAVCRLHAGAEVVCAETVMNPVQLYNADEIPEMEDELKFLFTIRSVFSVCLWLFARLLQASLSLLNDNLEKVIYNSYSDF